MRHFSLLKCEIEVDEEKTKQWYAHAEAWGCECADCINFLKIARKGHLPDQVLEYLSIFDIPPEKATYVCCLNKDKGMPFYQFSYRIAGTILKDHTSPVVEDVRFCHESYPYGAPGFPEPHFDLEFYVKLPRVTNDTAESAFDAAMLS